jgi:hypothetical protein
VIRTIHYGAAANDPFKNDGTDGESNDFSLHFFKIGCKSLVLHNEMNAIIRDKSEFIV